MYRIHSMVNQWIEILRNDKPIDKPKLIADLFGIQSSCESEVSSAIREGTAHKVEAAEYRGRVNELKERLESRGVALCFSILLNAVMVGIVSFILVRKS